MNVAPEPLVAFALLFAVVATLAFAFGRRGPAPASPTALRRAADASVRLSRMRWRAMRSIAHDEMVGELQRAISGDARLAPWLARFALDAFRAPTCAEPTARAHPEDDAPPPPCEREVLLLIASGYGYEEIAARLRVPTTVIEALVSSVLRKLELTER